MDERDPMGEPSGTGADHLPKLIGADIELGNFILGLERQGGTGALAAHALLREIDGVRAFTRTYSHGSASGMYGSVAPWGGATGGSSAWGGAAYGIAAERPDHERGPTGRGAPDGHDASGGWAGGGPDRSDDWGRRFLSSNGGSVYIDQNHLELAAPEVRSAFDHVATWHAMLRIARRALQDAGRRLPEGQRLQVMINNSDGRGNSYGSHLSFLITRSAWENLFERRLHYLVWLAGFQVSSVVWSGQGKVGAENGAEHADFQLAQRADFFEQLVGPQTTHARPLVNSRDEALCGRWQAGRAPLGARVHVIFFDNVLAPVACLLRAGTMQIALAMIEAGAVDHRLLLEDPLTAVRHWSHDVTLTARARTCDGRRLTALELQRLYYEDARAFAERGGLDGVVPRAGEILALWENTLNLLEQRDLDTLSRRLDWVLKLRLLERARGARHGLTWGDPALRHLDQLYGSLDPDEGLYWRFERGGLIDRVVDESEVRRFVHEPPDDTRAWTRAMLLRRAGPERIDAVDWDMVRLWPEGSSYGRPRTIDLDDPLGHGRVEAAPSFARETDLDALLDALEDTAAQAAFQRRDTP